jgi:hypothetical protein
LSSGGAAVKTVGEDAWAITLLGELCRFLETRKIIKARISKASIISPIIRGSGKSPIPELSEV